MSVYSVQFSRSVMPDSLWRRGLYSLQVRILEWVALPFSRGFSQPRDWTQVSYITSWFFTRWATGEAQPTPRAYKLMSIRLVVPSNHLILCHPRFPFSSCLQSFPASGSFQMSLFLTSGGQSIGVLSSASVLPMNIQDWFPLGLTGWISFQSKGLSRVFSSTTFQKHQFFGAQLSL